MSAVCIRILLVFTTLCLVGCRAEIDEAKLLNQIRGKNPTFARLQDRYPDLIVTFAKTNSGFKGDPVLSRFLDLQAEAKLNNGDRLICTRTYEIDSNGDAIINEKSALLNWRCVQRQEEQALLTKDEFELLMEAADVNPVLADIGIDFDRPPIDETKVVTELRQISPQIEKVHALSPNTRSYFDVPPHRFQGTMSLIVPLGRNLELMVTWQIRLPNGEGFAQLSDGSEPLFLLSNENAGAALTTENVDLLLSATNPAQEAEAIWSDLRQ